MGFHRQFAPDDLTFTLGGNTGSRQNSEIQGLFLHKFINHNNPENTLLAGHAEKHKVITVAVNPSSIICFFEDIFKNITCKTIFTKYF